jgi:hypothetical protein
VLWTDLPRSAFAEDGDPEARRFADWARRRGVILANVFEVFHADAPMMTHAQVVLEMAKQLPRGYAAASDHAAGRADASVSAGSTWTETSSTRSSTCPSGRGRRRARDRRTSSSS